MGEVFTPDSSRKQSGFLRFARRIPPAWPQESWRGIPVARLKGSGRLGLAGQGRRATNADLALLWLSRSLHFQQGQRAPNRQGAYNKFQQRGPLGSTIPRDATNRGDMQSRRFSLGLQVAKPWCKIGWKLHCVLPESKIRNRARKTVHGKLGRGISVPGKF